MRAPLLALALLLLAPAARPALPTGGGPTTGRWRGQALGLCFEGSPRPLGEEALDELVPLGVNAISLTPFAFMRDPHAPELRFDDPREPLRERGWWGEHAEGLSFVAGAAHARGIGTLLKPHVWLHGSWPGEVEMGSDADWASWFASYREFLLGWARFASEHGIEGLCLGTELDRTVAHEREWRALIADVRACYSGLLTYAANWTHFEDVPFWDALDAIGVNAYFPLCEAQRPQLDQVVAAWTPIRTRLEELSRRVGRPVVFTEIGYHPAAGALARPWEWDAEGAAFEPGCQAVGYEAVLRVFLDEPWFGGVFWWKWSANPRPSRHGAPPDTFSPRGLAAEDVLRRFYEERDAGGSSIHR